MKKNILLLLSSLMIQQLSAQVLITDYKSNEEMTPDPSAQLEVRHNTKGVYLPQVPLQNARDNINVKSPKEGTLVFNTTKGLPESKYEGMAVWDGEKWLFSNNEADLSKTLDVVQNRSYDGTPNVEMSDFPNEEPHFNLGDKFDANKWRVLVENATDTYFKYNPQNGIQKLVIDAEGLGAIDNTNYPSGIAYAIGVFVDNKLVSVRKFRKESVSGTCNYLKFNVRGELIAPAYFTRPAREAYNIKLAVTLLPKMSNEYNSIIFGGAAYGCNNLNEDTAKTYVNILRIEREK